MSTDHDCSGERIERIKLDLQQRFYENGVRFRQALPLSPGDEIDVNGWTFRVIKAGMGAVVMKPMRPVIEKQVSDGAKEESQ